MKYVNVRISERQHKALAKIRKENGPSVQWQVAYAVDLYLQEHAETAKPKSKEQAA